MPIQEAIVTIQEAIVMLRGSIVVLALGACGAAAANPCVGPPPLGVPAAHSSQTAAEASNREVVNELIEQAINRQNFDVVDRLLADDIVEHDEHQAKGVSPKQAFIDSVRSFDRAFPGGRMYVDGQVTQGDIVVTRWHSRATHGGEFMGIPATGKAICMTGMFYDRLDGGKLKETWAVLDLFGLMQQLRAK